VKQQLSSLRYVKSVCEERIARLQQGIDDTEFAPDVSLTPPGIGDQGAVSLTYLSILKEGFTPFFSATLSYGKRAFHHKKTGVTFSISLGKRRPSITFYIG